MEDLLGLVIEMFARMPDKMGIIVASIFAGLIGLSLYIFFTP
jgi:hypothetical protein